MLLPDEEMSETQEFAVRARLTVAACVRCALDDVKRRQASGDPARKVAAIRAAASHEFPSGDIASMLGEIEQVLVAGPSVLPPVVRRQTS